MRATDLDAVVELEARAVEHPWPAGAYLHEVEVNPLAQYFVARLSSPTLSRPAWLSRRRGGRPPTPSTIVGFAGLWMHVDEAHVSMIAVDPRYRRRHIAERLLVQLFEHAREHGAALMTLEVAASNQAARRLYVKYGFAVVGERRAYYEETGEDAVIMTTPPLADPAWRDRFARLRAALGMRAEASATGE